MHRSIAFLLALTATAPALAAPTYSWLDGVPTGDDLERRFPAPPGMKRVAVEAGSFAEFLRQLPLLPAGTAVHLFDGRLKSRQNVHAAVVNLDVGTRDLQQCADAVMRLRAEYLYSRKQVVRFHPDAGKARALEIDGASADRARFRKFLTRLFAEAGSASLQAELVPVGKGAIRPGDVLIQGGYPGHAVLVLDVAEDGAGRQRLLLGQSYMPAQQFHVLKNPNDERSPWYDAADLVRGLETPEWLPFLRKDLRRFRP